MKKCVFYLILFLVSVSLRGAPLQKMKQLSLEQGLNQAQVISMLQDSEGFIWIGTFEGLHFYDGYSLKLINGPDNALSTHAIFALHQDDSGNIWVGTTPNRNFKINKKSGVITEVKPIFPENYDIFDLSFIAFASGSAHNTWMATGQAIFEYDQKETLKLAFDFYSIVGTDHYIRKLWNHEHFLLVGTSAGLFRVNKSTKAITPIQYLTDDQIEIHSDAVNDKVNVKGLYQTNDNHLLIATVEGLYKVPLGTVLREADNSVIKLPGEVMDPHLNIWSVLEEENFYWLATNEGLIKRHKHPTPKKPQKQETVLKYSDTVFQIVDNNIEVMLKDIEGNLWLSSRSDGAFMWRPLKEDVKYYQQTNIPNKTLSHNVVWSIKEDKNGNFWAGTNNGINKIDPATGSISSFFINPDKKAAFTESTIHDLEVNDNSVWTMSDAGVKRFNIETGEEIVQLLAEETQRIFSLPGSDLFFADNDNLIILNSEGMFTYNITKNALSPSEHNVKDAHYSERFFIVLGTSPVDDDTLYFSMVDQVVKYSTQTGIKSVLHQLPPAEQHRVEASGLLDDGKHTWIAYPGFGIYIINNDTGKEVMHLTTDNGLPDNSPFQMIQDSDGYIWSTSNSGLSRIDPATFHVRLYDSYDGLASNELNSGAAISTSTGQFLLGGVKGITHIDPLELAKTNSTGRLHTHITHVGLMSRELPKQFSGYYDQELELYHDDFGIEIEFSSLRYSNIDKLKYKYWIEGDAATPPVTIITNHLLLPKLNAGKSVFHVSVIDYETGLESEAETLKITVIPAPYLSWWALTLYGLSGCLIVFIIYWQRRTKRLALLNAHTILQTNEERLKLALKGSDSGLWDWQKTNNQVFEPRLSSKVDRHIPFQDKLSAIHVDERAYYEKTWEAFILQTQTVFDVSYRLKVKNEWRWFRELARVTERDQEGQAVRATGTYTDISKIKDDQDKINLFSEAFQSTRDFVMITDENLKVIDANQAFFSATLYTEEEVIGEIPRFIKGQSLEDDVLTEIVLNLIAKGQWEGEGVIERKHYDDIPVLINTTQFDSEQEHQRLVFAITDITKQKEAEEELKKLANYDILTGLPNRALLHDRINHAIEHSARTKLQFAVCFIDLDRFKSINDNLGHDVGDELLIEVATLLKQVIRQDDTVARIGGDEFVIILEDLTDPVPITRITQKIIEGMANLNFTKNYPLSSSPSIGIAVYPDDGVSAFELLKHSDTAMYHAKSLGRNNFQFFENSMNENAHQKLMLENEIKQAIENNEFSLVYQPKIDLKTGQVMGFEALARWIKSNGENVSPVEFIPIAEDLGLITHLTEQLICKALTQLSDWLTINPECTMAINLSARHLQDYDLPGFISQACIKTNVKPQNIELELTESVLMEDIKSASVVCNALNRMGIGIALDDFGTGYSSLKYLTQLPIQTLKIDRSFVWKVGDGQNEAIIDSIISLANTLNIKTVAEGIETQAQLQYLQSLNCDYCQGYYFSKPVSVTEASALLKNTFDV